MVELRKEEVSNRLHTPLTREIHSFTGRLVRKTFIYRRTLEPGCDMFLDTGECQCSGRSLLRLFAAVQLLQDGFRRTDERYAQLSLYILEPVAYTCFAVKRARASTLGGHPDMISQRNADMATQKRLKAPSERILVVCRFI